MDKRSSPGKIFLVNLRVLSMYNHQPVIKLFLIFCGKITDPNKHMMPRV